MIAVTNDTPAQLVSDLEHLLISQSIAAKKGSVPFVNSREAGVILGIPLNKQLNNKLKWLLNNGFIKQYSRSGQETHYWYEDLLPLAAALAKGDVNIPTNFSMK